MLFEKLLKKTNTKFYFLRGFMFFTLLTLFLTLASQKLFAEKKVILKLATLAPKSSTWGALMKDLQKMAYLKTKNSDQSILLKVYYGGVQGDEVEVAKKIRYGQLDGGFFTGNGLGELCKESRILDLPLSFRSFKEADFVYDKITDDLSPYFLKKGFVLGGIRAIGHAYFFSKHSVASIGDISKTKMWVWKGDQLVFEAMKVLKIPAIPVNFSEVSTALQTGLIDGVYSTPTALIALQWHKYLNVALDSKLTLVSSGVVFSGKKWKKLSKENQKILMDSVQKSLVKMGKKSRQDDIVSIRELKKSSIKWMRSKDDVGTIQAYADALKSALLGKMIPSKLMVRFRTLLEEYRKNS